MASGLTTWDAKMEELFGLDEGTFQGSFDAWVALLHPEDADRSIATVQAAIEAKSRYTVEHRVVWPDGTVHWLHGAGQVTLDPSGAVTGTIGCSADVTERVESERQRQRLTEQAINAAEKERLSRERLEFLGRINQALLGAQPPGIDGQRRATGRASARRLVLDPRACRSCGSAPDVEIAHVDPAMVAYADELRTGSRTTRTHRWASPDVIRTGETEFVPEIDDDRDRRTGATTDEARDIIDQLALRSVHHRAAHQTRSHPRCDAVRHVRARPPIHLR